ncbi:hypothetical protein [Streptomyces fulvoviolaceus]|uniref:hypothetical protein n=1 Tax=Streptomyces fulvoviolaceus TaxID=285535 RepID=UPI0021BECD9E|nr:hypothetical protein [Streptomyces fulvoviolaceus]MCT9084807.1 hypothetical protein [Streptomyces fulvoviolaceus]
MNTYDDMERTGMSTQDVEETGMSERAVLLDFPGADDLMAAGRVEPPSAQALARALAGIEAAVAAQEAGHAAGRKKGAVATAPLRGMSGRRRALVGLFTAAAVAAGVATYTNTGETPTGTRSETRADTASVFLNDISTVAATQSLSSGKYWKTHLTVGDSYLSKSMDFYVVNDGKAYKKGRQPDWQLGPKDLDWKALNQLTTDPAKLLQLLQTPPRPKSISPFDQALTLLGGSPASPKLRAGLFKAMAGLKGVTLVGTVKDSTGRSGTALEFAEAKSIGRVIVDPKTSSILEYTFTWTAGAGKGKATHQTYLSVGFTDKIG